MRRLKGSVAVVTGASSGIEFEEFLARHGERYEVELDDLVPQHG